MGPPHRAFPQEHYRRRNGLDERETARENKTTGRNYSRPVVVRDRFCHELFHQAYKVCCWPNIFTCDSRSTMMVYCCRA